ncbi:MAG: hypothetical protein HYY16_16225 [Planctomycetes bacterium]|nr:hypothetical protein [Planctomycetota bacterium]
MELGLIVVLYLVGLGLIVTEALLPGMVIGLIGTAALAASIILGFRYDTGLGVGQLALALIVGPLSVVLGLRRLTLRASLDKGASFAQDYSAFVGREGKTLTDLRPAGILLIDGRRLDVVSAGEPIPKGRRVRVVKVEGNRIVVRSIKEA